MNGDRFIVTIAFSSERINIYPERAIDSYTYSVSFSINYINRTFSITNELSYILEFVRYCNALKTKNKDYEREIKAYILMAKSLNLIKNMKNIWI